MNQRAQEIQQTFDNLQAEGGGGTIEQGASFVLGVRGKDAHGLLVQVVVQTITAYGIDYDELDDDVKSALLFAVRSGAALGVAAERSRADG